MAFAAVLIVLHQHTSIRFGCWLESNPLLRYQVEHQCHYAGGMAKTLDAFQISIVVIIMQIYMLYLIDANIDNMLADPDIFADFTNLGSWY